MCTMCAYMYVCTCMWDEGAGIKEIVHGIGVCVHVQLYMYVEF